MIIVLSSEDLLYELFPEAKKDGGSERLIHILEKYYTYGPFKPKVDVQNGLVTIEIDTQSIASQEEDFNLVVSLCEKGKFEAAKPLLEKLIALNPSNSEFHRIYGQILSDEGRNEEAIDSLIDALRWNPRNGYALTMMGNIFAKHKDDTDTALKYYDQAIKIDPSDFIAINNVGSNLMQSGKIEEGLKYLKQALAINPKYPNTLYGLALANDMQGDSLEAFEYGIKCMKLSAEIKDAKFFDYGLALVIKVSEDWIKTNEGKMLVDQFSKHLTKRGGIEIKITEDSDIPTAAKIEFAENYKRDHHLVKYKPKYLAVDHLVMHELVHLEFVLDARQEAANMLFTSTKDQKAKFYRDNQKQIERLTKLGYSETSISDFMSSLHEGILRQIFNTPIDLFIEDFLFAKYQRLKPYQFLSIYNLLMEGKKAITDKHGVELTPQVIFRASKILNLVNALQFKDLYGFDVTKQFEATQLDIKEAERLWSEYKEYRFDNSPSEEYELVQHWGEDLGLDSYFELIDENEFRNPQPKKFDDILSSIERDPLGIETDLDFKDTETKTFLESQKAIGTNPAVMWFMVSALKYFNDVKKEEVKKTALEIALLGTQGINPASDNHYKLNSIPGVSFSGYHLLAYYYVSWKLAIPEMVKQLNLPYDKEYEMALGMYKTMGND